MMNTTDWGVGVFWLTVTAVALEIGRSDLNAHQVSPPGEVDPFATGVVAFGGPFGPSPYDDAGAVLGMPATDFLDPLAEWSGRTAVRRVKLIEGACNLDPTRRRKLLTTLGNAAFVVVRFNQPIRDHPAHPYGIDLLVFGNAFFPSSGFADDLSDLNTLVLTGGAFAEPMKVSVSPGYTGRPGQNQDDWRTWDWYTFENGPYADTAFPTQAYMWNRTNAVWTGQLMDFTKPVNPVLDNLFDSAEEMRLSAADAVDLYVGSGGGTGFDINESGFAAIQYVKIEGLPGFEGGEIDALAAVRPIVLGDTLSVAPANIVNGTAKLMFQCPYDASMTAVAVEFLGLGDVARVSATAVTDLPANVPEQRRVLEAIDLAVSPIFSGNELQFRADIRIAAGPHYRADGDHLELLSWTDHRWTTRHFDLDSANGAISVTDVTNSVTLVLCRVLPPELAVLHDSNGFTLRFIPVPQWTNTLERTLDFDNWMTISTATPESAKPITVNDAVLQCGSAFYRLRAERPRRQTSQLGESQGR